jgi:phage-related protein
MAVTSKTLFRGAATTSTGTTLYTVPSATTTVISNIAVTNTSGSAGTFTLALAGTALHTTTAIAANTTIYIDCKQTLTATQTITGGASATSINLHISGVEIA